MIPLLPLHTYKQVELPQMMSKEASRSIWLLSHNDEKPGIQAIEINLAAADLAAS